MITIGSSTTQTITANAEQKQIVIVKAAEQEAEKQRIKEEAEKKEKERIRKKKEEQEKKKKARKKKLDNLSAKAGRKVIGYTKIKATLSYYTSLASENGGYANMTASGVKPQYGCVANNSLKFGTDIYFKGIGTFEVQDRGCSNFNNVYRYDVYIPRNNGESDNAYLARVNNLGKKTVTAYILEFK